MKLGDRKIVENLCRNVLENWIERDSNMSPRPRRLKHLPYESLIFSFWDVFRMTWLHESKFDTWENLPPLAWTFSPEAFIEISDSCKYW